MGSTPPALTHCTPQCQAIDGDGWYQKPGACSTNDCEVNEVWDCSSETKNAVSPTCMSVLCQGRWESDPLCHPAVPWVSTSGAYKALPPRLSSLVTSCGATDCSLYFDKTVPRAHGAGLGTVTVGLDSVLEALFFRRMDILSLDVHHLAVLLWGSWWVQRVGHGKVVHWCGASRTASLFQYLSGMAASLLCEGVSFSVSLLAASFLVFALLPHASILCQMLHDGGLWCGSVVFQAWEHTEVSLWCLSKVFGLFVVARMTLILFYNVVNVVSLLFDHYAFERILLYMVLLEVTHPFYGKMLWWLVKMVLGLRSVAQKFLNCRRLIHLALFLYLMASCHAMDPDGLGTNKSALNFEDLNPTMWPAFIAAFEAAVNLNKTPCGLPLREPEKPPLRFSLSEDGVVLTEASFNALSVSERAQVADNDAVYQASLEYRQSWEKQNFDLFWRLQGCAAKSTEARQILQTFKDSCDGSGAFRALQAAAMGSKSGETAEGLLTRLFELPSDMDLKELHMMHFGIVQRLEQFQSITLDMIYKFSLLRLLRDHPEALHYQLVEDMASKPEVTYREACSLLKDTIACSQGPRA